MKNKNNFKEQVYEIVRKIPKGKVSTYGEIATKLGRPGWSRQVGWALHQNKFGFSSKNQNLRSSQSKIAAGLKDLQTPCHRVVDRNGRLAPNFAFDGWREQKRRLLAEGVIFVDATHVDLPACSWD